MRAVVALSTATFGPAVSAYARLLGAGAATTATEHQWQVGATRLVVRAGSERARLLVSAGDLVGPGAPDVYAAATALLARRSCEVVAVERVSGARAGVVDDLPVGIVDTRAVAPLEPAAGAEVSALDHVVASSSGRDGALALFSAGLGFDFRLEQRLVLPHQGEVHQLFLRGAGTIVEVLVAGAGDPGIALWGLAWASSDIDATHARMSGAGADLSRIRGGHKRGTRVFTVRGADVIVPTIVIGHDSDGAGK